MSVNGSHGKGLCACAFGVAVGLTWMLGVVIMGVTAWQFQYGEAMVTSLGSFYWGYAGTPAGIVYGAIWGFVDGFIGGFIVAWIYNFCVRRCPCKSCRDNPGGEVK